METAQGSAQPFVGSPSPDTLDTQIAPDAKAVHISAQAFAFGALGCLPLLREITIALSYPFSTAELRVCGQFLLNFVVRAPEVVFAACATVQCSRCDVAAGAIVVEPGARRFADFLAVHGTASCDLAHLQALSENVHVYNSGVFASQHCFFDSLTLDCGGRGAGAALGSLSAGYYLDFQLLRCNRELSVAQLKAPRLVLPFWSLKRLVLTLANLRLLGLGSALSECVCCECDVYRVQGSCRAASFVSSSRDCRVRERNALAYVLLFYGV